MKKLFTSIRQGKLDEVKTLIEKKPELVICTAGSSPKKDQGQSPLQVALKTAHYEIADYLISHGADVNFMEAEDDNPGLRAPVLFDAITAAIVSLCYNEVSESETAFRYAQLLIEKGADVNKLASNGYDAINWSITRAEPIFERASIYPDVQDAVRKQLTKILDLLIENGSDYAAWADRGYFPAPYSEPTNRNMFIDKFTPRTENDIDRVPNTRAFMQSYSKSRNLQI